MLTYLIAFLVALTTVKLWNLLRLNPRMRLISRTLQKAWGETLGFLLTLLVLLTGYAFAVRSSQAAACLARSHGVITLRQGHSRPSQMWLLTQGHGVSTGGGDRA